MARKPRMRQSATLSEFAHNVINCQREAFPDTYYHARDHKAFISKYNDIRQSFATSGGHGGTLIWRVIAIVRTAYGRINVVLPGSRRDR